MKPGRSTERHPLSPLLPDRIRYARRHSSFPHPGSPQPGGIKPAPDPPRLPCPGCVVRAGVAVGDEPHSRVSFGSMVSQCLTGIGVFPLLLPSRGFGHPLTPGSICPGGSEVISPLGPAGRLPVERGEGLRAGSSRHSRGFAPFPCCLPSALRLHLGPPLRCRRGPADGAVRRAVAPSRAGLTGWAGGGGGGSGSGSESSYRPAARRRRAIRRHPPRPSAIVPLHPAPQALPAPHHHHRWVSGAGGGRAYLGR